MSTVRFSSVLLIPICSGALLKICQLLDITNYTFSKGLGSYLHFTGFLEKILTEEVAPVTWCEGAEESCSARQCELGAPRDTAGQQGNALTNKGEVPPYLSRSGDTTQGQRTIQCLPDKSSGM